MARKPKPPKVTAKHLLDLLLNRHSDDVCVPECKTGSTWGTTGAGRLDLWAMKKSWAHPQITGYEIKVSRRDFLSDNKWPGYLPFCNCLYFVAAPGVIQPDELGPEVGLLVSASTGTRLYTKKKAPYREVEIPEDLYRYILMSRCTITRNMWDHGEESEAEYWRRWLAEKQENRKIGHRVSKELQRMVTERIRKVERRNDELQHLLKGAEESIAALQAVGLWPPHKYSTERHIREALEAQAPGLPKRFVRHLDDVARDIKRIKEELDPPPKPPVSGEDRDIYLEDEDEEEYDG